MAIAEFTTEEINNEIWKPVVGYEGLYEVSNLGRIKRLAGTYGARQDRFLCLTTLDKHGYPQVGLSKQCRTQTHRIHRVVAYAFLGDPPEGRDVVNHIDHNRTNNRLTNLEWCSALENTKHMLAAGRHIRGMRQKDAKLIDDDIPIIRYLLDRGFVLVDIARCFSVSITTIHRIKQGRLWKHVPQPEKVGLFE